MTLFCNTKLLNRHQGRENMWHTPNIKPKISTYSSYWPWCQCTTDWAFTNVFEISIALRVSIGVILIYLSRCSGPTCLTRNCNLILIDKRYLDGTWHYGVRQVTLFFVVVSFINLFREICLIFRNNLRSLSSRQGPGLRLCLFSSHCELFFVARDDSSQPLAHGLFTVVWDAARLT